MRILPRLGILVGAFSAPLLAEWESTSGPVDLVQIHCMAFKDSQMFTGVLGHGIFKTIDDGKTWRRPNTDWAGLVRGLGFQGRYLLAAGEYGFFRSADDGETWRYSVQGIKDLNLQALAVDGAQLYVGARDSGVYASADSAETWTQAGEGLPRAAVLSILSGSGSVLAGTAGSGLFRSADKGLNWARVSAGSRNDLTIFALAQAGGYVYAGTDIGLYRLGWDGGGWTDVSPVLAGRRVHAFLARGSRFYAATDSGVFVSGDSGAQWRMSGMAGLSVRSLGERGGIVYAGTDWFGLYRSADQGESWTARNEGYAYAYANLVVRSGNALLAAATPGSGVTIRAFRTTDAGNTWTPVLPGVAIAGLAADGSHAYALDPDGVVYQSFDAGATWKAASNPSPIPALKGMVSGSLNLSAAPGWLFASGKDGIYRSQEGAGPWERMPVDMTTLSWYWLKVVGSQLYFRGDSATLRSRDMGATWESTTLPRYAIPFCAIGSHQLARGTGQLLRSDDDGATWQETGFRDSLVSDIIAARQDFYVSDYGGRLSRSADFGRTWTHFIMDSAGRFLIGSMAAGDDFLFAAAGKGGVLRRKWEEVATPINPPMREPGMGNGAGILETTAPGAGRNGKVVLLLPAGREGRLTQKDISGRQGRVLWEGRSDGKRVEIGLRREEYGTGVKVFRLESGAAVHYRVVPFLQ